MSHLRIKVHILYRRVLIKTLAYLNSTCSQYANIILQHPKFVRTTSSSFIAVYILCACRNPVTSYIRCLVFYIYSKANTRLKLVLYKSRNKYIPESPYLLNRFSTAP